MGGVAAAAGERIRVLVVDDSVVIRRLVTHALSEEPLLEVVGTASNGLIALQRIEQLQPQVITLDVEMPGMNGLDTLREIRKRYPRLFVIMFSTLTERGAASTMEALSLGANDYVTKASNSGSLDASIRSLRTELIPKIRQFFRVADESEPAAVPAGPRPPAPRSGPVRRQVVAIGVSTGGPAALASIVPQFPADFPLPVVIVQHMPPLFTRLLAERLQGHTALKVEESHAGAAVQPGRILIAPGDYHMRLKRQGLGVEVTLDQGPPENSCRPAVDVLFRSVAECYGGAVVAVILTGMGQDGLRGVQVLRPLGAYVIAQDEASSVVWGMPGFVTRSGLADAVLDLGHVVPEVVRQSSLGRVGT